MAELDNINKIAQAKFSELKTKMQLDKQKPIIEEIIRVSNEKVEKLFNSPVPLDRDSPYIDDGILNSLYIAASDEVRKIDAVFDYINKLELTPNLSLAIGLIISYNKTKDKQELAKAISALNQEQELF